MNQPPVSFPCESLPADAGLARLLGLYPQRQEGLWMQRVRVPGGRLSGTQWRALGEICDAHSQGQPLHLTTRQDIEFHGLTEDAVPLVQQALVAAGLDGLGACGDTLRNITLCTCSGVAAGSADLMPLAMAIRTALLVEEGVFDLPRKFKINICCGDQCGQPYIHDLGLVLSRREGAVGFNVIGAGSLGAKPATGVELFEWVSADEVVPLAVAAVRLFAREGDRENRWRARFRHARQRLGDEAFLTALQESFRAARAERDWPAVAVPDVVDGLEATVALTFANGDITPEQARALAFITADGGAVAHVAAHHRVIIFGRSTDDLADRIGRHACLALAARPQAAIVACPGNRWCKAGLADTNAMADAIRRRLSLPAGLTVCVSGCPNGCAHNAVADIGLTGGTATRDGQKTDVFTLLVGGGLGRTGRLAEVVAAKLTLDEVIDQIGQLDLAAMQTGSGALTDKM